MKLSHLCAIVAGLLLLAAATFTVEPPGVTRSVSGDVSRIWDNQTYINANKILMFVTNHGNFGRDLSGVFGRDAGTFYPYVSIEDIQNGTLDAYALYAAGIWIGGRVNGLVRVAVAEYSDEYVPGPMVGGAHQPDNPSFKVYKLYRDSLADNPNDDYLNWPVDQGAPVDATGQPSMRGDQMLWTVFNDADAIQHQNRAGGTLPLGIEIQQTVWAIDEAGDDTLWIAPTLRVHQVVESRAEVEAHIVNPDALTGHDYQVEIDSIVGLGAVWHLIDATLGDTVLTDQTNFSGDENYQITDGFQVKVIDPTGGFTSFEVVANLAGALIPSEGAAAGFAGFPSNAPTDRQQIGDGMWFFHTADNGGTSGGGTRGSYEAFLQRVTRNGGNNTARGNDDYEMRFTGSNDNPGIGGSWAIEAFNDDNVFWVPFELWNIGCGTPDDYSDDVRLVVFIIDDGNDNIYALESWGNPDIGGGDLEHSVSGGDDDPFTDWVYWYKPTDESPGVAGYIANVAQMLTGTYDYSLVGDDVLARTVLVNWNGGTAPPFNQNTPELGTVFRITTAKDVPIGVFTFTATAPPPITSGNEGVSLYMKYRLYNKGSNTINDMYVSLWSDPDLGGAGDDLVGCDTLDDVFFCYNSTNDDAQYYSRPPALGFKILAGPVVPSPGDTADFDGSLLPDHRNLGLISFQKYINGTDPNGFIETYNYMQGLNADGTPLPNGTHYAVPGDPVTGIGDVDYNAADRRMMANCGPLTLPPGGSQYLLVKMAVGQGNDRLESITKLKEILNMSGPCCAIRGDINHDGSPVLDISDLIYLVNYMFQAGPEPYCLEEADVNASGSDVIDIGDLIYLIDYMFGAGPEPPPCP